MASRANTFGRGGAVAQNGGASRQTGCIAARRLAAVLVFAGLCVAGAGVAGASAQGASGAQGAPGNQGASGGQSTTGAQGAPGGQSANLGRVQDFYPTGEAGTSIIAFERLAPLEIRPGIEFEYTLILRNLTNAPINNVTLTEQAADGVRIVSMTPEPHVRGGADRAWNFETLEPRGTKQVVIRGTAERAGDVTACAAVAVQSQTCARLRVVQPELAFEAKAPAEVLACDPVPVKFTVRNPGTGIASGVVIRTTLPEGWTIDSKSSEAVINVGDLAAGQARDYTLMARATRGGEFETCATAEGAGGLSARGCAKTRIVKPVLELAADVPETRYLGRPAKFDLVVTNKGDGPARDLTITAPLPAGLKFIDASDGGKLNGTQLAWSLGALGAGEKRTLGFTASADKAGQIRTTATAKAACADASTELTVEMRGIPALSLEVVDLADPVEVGGSQTYTIRVANQGTAPATAVRIECTLPPEESFVSAEGPGKHAADGQKLTFESIPTLPPGQALAYRVVVKGVSEGDARFVVKLSTEQLKTPVTETESTQIY